MRTIHRVDAQPAYILYARPFRENSLLLEAFSRDYGRVSLVARGVRKTMGQAKGRSKSDRFQGLLQPFVPLLVSWYGRGDLFNLVGTESNGLPLPLEGPLLISGWYMNELLVRTLKHWDVYTDVFLAYQTGLSGLSVGIPMSLRRFEKMLLTALGVMPQLDHEKETGEWVRPTSWYLLHPQDGVSLVDAKTVPNSNIFQGEVLLAITSNHFEHKAYWSSMKRLFRLLFDPILDGRKIRSRDLLSIVDQRSFA